jgi:hypothetical protein
MRGLLRKGLAPLIFLLEPIMKAIIALVAIVCVVYGAMGTLAAKQSTTTVQKSLDRMTAVDAALK